MMINDGQNELSRLAFLNHIYVLQKFENFYLVNVYTPNSGDGLKRLDYRVGSWDKQFTAYIKELEMIKPVILTGDLNCAHQEIDIHSPSTNKKSAGFTQVRSKYAVSLQLKEHRLRISSNTKKAERRKP